MEPANRESEMATTTVTVKTNAELSALGLSFYSLAKLADILECVDPCQCLEHRLTHRAFADKGWKGQLTLDQYGNLLAFA